MIREYEEVLEDISAINEILENPERLQEVIEEELKAVKEEFGDERKTPIEDKLDLSTEDLITPEDMVVTISNIGYAKTQPLEVYHLKEEEGWARLLPQ